jgi:hypothetical protein
MIEAAEWTPPFRDERHASPPMSTSAPLASPFAKFGDFLHAPIHEEAGGMPLTVLSALARREIDAWEFAARLDLESSRTRVTELTALIAMLPSGMPPQESPDLIVRRLLALLPCERRTARPASVGAIAGGAQAAASLGYLQLIIGSVFFAVFSFWVFGRLLETAPVTATTAVTTAETTPATTTAQAAAKSAGIPASVAAPLSAAVAP